MVLPPGQMHELAVGRHAIDDRVAVGEIAGELAEARDLGGADEGEVLRPEEHDLPFALVGRLVEVAEGRLGVGGHHALDGKIGEFIAYSQHLRGNLA